MSKMLSFTRRHSRSPHQTLSALRRALCASYSSASPSPPQRSTYESSSHKTLPLSSSSSSSSSSLPPRDLFVQTSAVKCRPGDGLTEAAIMLLDHCNGKRSAVEMALPCVYVDVTIAHTRAVAEAPNIGAECEVFRQLCFSPVEYVTKKLFRGGSGNPKPTLSEAFDGVSEVFSQCSISQVKNVAKKPLRGEFSNPNPTLLEAFDGVLVAEYPAGVVDPVIPCSRWRKERLVQQYAKASDVERSHRPIDVGKVELSIPGLQQQFIPLEASSVKRKRKKKMNKHKQRKLRRRDRHRK